MFKRISTFLIFILAASLLAVPAAASAPAASGPEPLFTPAPSPESPQQVDAGTPILRSTYVYLNQVDFASQEQIRLNLLPDVDLVASRQRSETPFAGAWNWVGKIDGDPDSEVTFASVDGVLTGNIRTRGAFYQVNAAAGSLYRINQLDPLGFPDEQTVLAPQQPAPAVPLSPSQLQDDGSTFDVLIVYTANAASTAAASGGILNKINLAVSESNTGYQNSQIIPRMRLAHFAQVSYSESYFNWNTTLDLLTANGDGYMDEVHTLRDSYGADLVALVVSSSYNSTCGMGWQLGGLQPAQLADEAYAFSVVALPCFTGYYSLAHEMGHNMGSEHDRNTAGLNTGSYTYSYGYQAPDRAFRTIMAYDCSGGCQRINFWSNPNVSYGGQPVGISSGASNAADNHMSINNNRVAISNWRQEKELTPPQVTFNALQTNKWYSNNAAVSWTVTDAGSGVDYYKWGWDTPTPLTQVSAAQGSTQLSAAGQGKHTLYVDAWDKAANKGSASLGWLGYDTQAPSILSINSGCSAPDRQWQNTCRLPFFTWSASDPGGANASGTSGYLYAWAVQVQSSPGASTTSTAYSAPAVAPVDGAGKFYLSLKTYDLAGNVSGLASYGVWYDGAPPTLQPSVNFGARYVTTTSVTIQPGGQDSASGLKSLIISNDGSTWQTLPYASSINWTLTGQVGTLNTVYLKLEDNVGNRSAAFPIKVCREPSGGLTHPAGCWKTTYLPIVSRPVH